VDAFSNFSVAGPITMCGDLASQLPRLFELMDEVLKSPQFDSKGMVTSFVRETVASMEASFISSGVLCS
jgi:hypothetical protein